MADLIAGLFLLAWSIGLAVLALFGLISVVSTFIGVIVGLVCWFIFFTTPANQIVLSAIITFQQRRRQ